MNDERRPTSPLDDVLDASLAGTVRRAARADLRARVMARVGQERPGSARPVPNWTAVAAAAVVMGVVAAHALRTAVTPSRATARETRAEAQPLPSPAPAAGMPAAVRGVAAPEKERAAFALAARAPGPRRDPGDQLLEADVPTPLRIDPLEHPPSPIVPLHTDDLVIVPLVIEDAGSLSSEDRP